MDELQRIAYLEAMGVDGYVSRQQLPGAAPTRRLALVPAEDQAPAAGAPESPGTLSEVMPAEAEPGKVASPLSAMLQQGAPAPTEKKRGEVQQPVTRPAVAPGLQFKLAVIIAGQYLWVEELGDMPLMSEQVWLIEAMARALHSVEGLPTGSPEQPSTTPSDKTLNGKVKAEVMYFNWPLHNNPQFESGIDAAQASLTGFVERKCQEYACRGVILLGESCSQWLPQVSGPHTSAVLPNSVQLLADATLKRDAWARLLAAEAVAQSA